MSNKERAKEEIKFLIELKEKSTDERVRIQAEIKETDQQIDQEVYKIYGLSKEEIEIIEESLK